MGPESPGKYAVQDTLFILNILAAREGPSIEGGQPHGCITSDEGAPFFRSPALALITDAWELNQRCEQFYSHSKSAAVLLVSTRTKLNTQGPAGPSSHHLM